MASRANQELALRCLSDKKVVDWPLRLYRDRQLRFQGLLPGLGRGGNSEVIYILRLFKPNCQILLPTTVAHKGHAAN